MGRPTIQRQSEAIEGIGRWTSELPNVPPLQRILGYFQHWYFDPESGSVGPSKFIGYPRLTGQAYVSAASAPDEISGSETEKTLKRWFQELPRASAEYKFVRGKVEHVIGQYGRFINKRAKMHAPPGWRLSRANPENPSGQRTAVHEPDAAYRALGRGLQRTIKASVYPDEEGYYVAECFNIAVATQGRTIEETLRNLQEAVSVHLEGEDLEALGLAPNPSILVTMELEPAVA